MITKRIVVSVLGVILALGLLVAVFVGAVGGLVLYSIGHSDAATTARTFLKSNERLKQDTGEVKDFGYIVTGNVHIKDAEGRADLHLKVIGEKRIVNADVDLIYREGRPWRVVGASYWNEAGQRVDLLNAYESRFQISSFSMFQISDPG